MVRRPVLVCFFLLLCTAAVNAQAPSTSAPAQEAQPVAAANTVDYSSMSVTDLERTGDDLRGRKEYLQAVDCYKAVNKRQESAVVYNKIGLSYLGMRQLDPAQKAFERAAKLDKKYPEAYNSLGVVYYLKNKSGKAIKYYRKALALREESAYFHSNLGTAYISQNETERGIAEYRRAYELDPKVFESRSHSGITAWMSGPADRARYAYVMAKIYAGGGDLDSALQWLRRAMEDGYQDIKNVYKEAEFAKLREDQRFTELMSQKPLPIQ